MQQPADKLMSDLMATVEAHRHEAPSDDDLNELHKVAESAIEMLMVIRQRQLERPSGQNS